MSGSLCWATACERRCPKRPFGAIARDAAGNRTTSLAVAVTVDNAAPPPPTTTGLVAAYGFGEGAGTTTRDASGTGNPGAISGAAWTAAGRYGSTLSFDGVDDSSRSRTPPRWS